MEVQSRNIIALGSRSGKSSDVTDQFGNERLGLFWLVLQKEIAKRRMNVIEFFALIRRLRDTVGVKQKTFPVQPKDFKVDADRFYVDLRLGWSYVDPRLPEFRPR